MAGRTQTIARMFFGFSARTLAARNYAKSPVLPGRNMFQVVGKRAVRLSILQYLMDC